ncbi:MAG: PQQ-like beta-propeller repeat protein [Armatimonadetes bacterium]|nr:PQQ-like beta-propeller repeat protein [Armatimonadota bacterium]
MNRHRPRSFVVVVALLIGIVSSGMAQDWPQWLGPNRDGKPSQFNAPEQWPAQLTQQWQAVVGAGDATPAVVGGMVYVFSRIGEEEVTTCLRLSDGSVVWQDKYSAMAVQGPASSHPGPRSSPAVAEGKVVTLGVTGVASCLDAASGQVLWRKAPYLDAFPQFYTASSPLITNGMAILQVGAEDNGGLVALDLATGDEKWKWAGEGPQYASPVRMALGDREIVVALTSKSFIGVSAADGQLLWQLPFVPEGRAYNASTPIVSGDQVIISGAGRGTMAFRVATDGGAVTATPLWTNTEVAVQFNTPILKDGLLYGLSNAGKLFCLKADTGDTVWVDDNVRSRGFGAVVDAGTALMALPDNGDLIVYGPGAEGFTLLATYKVAEGGTYAAPVLSGSSIITKDQSAVTLWSLP